MGPTEKINDQVTGFLLLLLILLLLFSSKIVTLQSDPGEAPCPEPLFVQVDGEVRNPGVYPFCSTPTVQDLIENAGGLKQGGAFLHVPTGWNASSGERIVFTFDGQNYNIHESPMSPFHKFTLGIPLSLNEESEEGLRGGFNFMDTTNVYKHDLDVPTILRVKSPSSHIEEPEYEEPETSLSEKASRYSWAKEEMEQKEPNKKSNDDDDESSSFLRMIMD